MAIRRKRPAKRPMAARRGRVTFDTARRLALALPGVEDGLSYRTPALKVDGKLLARLKEDGESMVIRIGFLEREALMEAAPDVFYITDHYRNYPAMLIHLSKVREDVLGRLLEDAWREAAPKRALPKSSGRG